jgi:hypothetical protein
MIKGFCCRKHLIQTVADIDVKPWGYGDRGKMPGHLQF